MSANSKNFNSIDWTVLPAASISAHTEEWDVLNQRSIDLPILDADFFAKCLEHFGTGKEMLVLGHSEHDLVAAGIFVECSVGVWSTFQPSQAPLGAWLARSELHVSQAMAYLGRELPSLCLVLGISQQDPKLSQRPANEACLRTLDYIDTACVPVSGSFDEYWAKRGRNLRQNLNRQRNRMARENVQTRLEIVVEKDQIGNAVDDYARLESQGWKSKKGTALHPDNNQGRFYRKTFENFAVRGDAVVYRYWYDDNMVASDLCVKRNDVMIILKTAHDEAFSKTSPTHLMRQEYFRLLFDTGGIQCIEFYGRLMDWHTKWSDDIRRMYHVNYYRWPLLARIKGILTSGRTKQD